MTIENWVLVVSIFGNIILLYQWRDSVNSAAIEMKKEVLQSALLAKETAYSSHVSLRFALRDSSLVIPDEMRKGLMKSADELDTHSHGLLELHNVVSLIKKPKISDLEVLRTQVGQIASEAKDIAHLVDEFRKQHVRA